MKLKDCVAIVTGAGQGIGRAISRTFAAEGAVVVVTDINPTTAQQVADEIVAGGGQAIGRRLDVSSGADIAVLVQETAERYGRIDILVNNAGLAVFRSVEACTEAEWDQVFAVNLKGPFLLSKACMPHLKKRGKGAIINLASIAGKTGGVVAGAPYSVSKAGIDCLTKSLARELAGYRVRVNAICPGYVLTPLVQKQIREQAKARGISEEAVIRDVLLAAQPTKRFVEVSEIAAVTAFLCSDGARSITGVMLPVDGGWTAH